MHHRGIRNCVYMLLRQLLKQPKLYLVLTLLALIVDEYVGSARQIVKNFHIHVNAYGSFACITSYSYLLLWIVLGYLVLLSDAPYVSAITLFESQRVSARHMLQARIIYVVLVSFSYVQLIFVMASLLQFASFAQPSVWDKALNTMSYGNAVGSAYLYVPRVVITHLSPIWAWFLSSLLLSLSLSSIGLMMLIGTLILDKKIVLSVAGILAALDFAISYMNLPNILFFFSPVSWSRLEIIMSAEHFTARPSALYCIWMQIVLFILLCSSVLLFSFRAKHITNTLIIQGGSQDA